MTNIAPLDLICHPATPAPVVRSIDVQVDLLPDGGIAFAYCLRGDMARLLIPVEPSPERADLLWEHTCFEAFIGVQGETAYHEFNFSPSGQWAAYAFSDYRQRVDVPPGGPAPQITARLFAGRLELEASVTAAALPANPANAAWQIGLAAVVEAADTVDGSHSYWALRHPAARPDFHQRETFALELPCIVAGNDVDASNR
ncbi:MAG: DOMON-like domain-containing protein [Propionivibrio sp.]